MAVVNSFKKTMLDEALDLGTLKVMLLTNIHTTNVDTQVFIDDVSANEISSAGYTAGGATLSSVTTAIDTDNNWVELNFANPSWTGLTATVQYAVWYIDTGTPATSSIISISNLGATALTAQDLTLSINDSGVLYF